MSETEQEMRTLLSDIWEAWAIECNDGDKVLSAFGDRIKATLERANQQNADGSKA